MFRNSKKFRACTPNSLVRVSCVRAGVALCASRAYRADRTLKKRTKRKDELHSKEKIEVYDGKRSERGEVKQPEESL